MDEDRAGTVREWNSRSVEGHEGLRRLAAEEFSGVIETDRGSIRAYMTNGRIVGIERAGIDDLDGMTMTAYRAPDDAIPLLFAMQERGGDLRAEYYTEETAISEVNRTLEEAGFTGYVELSENVLSGDYYVVYHGGRSSSVAFVGSSARLVTGDDAFERADGEVGIYEVVDVDVPVIDVPDAEGADAGAGTGTGAGGAVAGSDAGTGTGAGTDRGSDPGTGETGGATATGEASDPTRDGTGGTGGTSDEAPEEESPGAGSPGTSPGTASADPSTRPSADPGRPDRSGGAGDGSSSGGTGPYGTGEEIRVGAGLGLDEDEDEGGGEADEGGADEDAPGAGDEPGDATRERSPTRPGERGEQPTEPTRDAPEGGASDGTPTDDPPGGRPDRGTTGAGAGTDAPSTEPASGGPSREPPSRTADTDGAGAARNAGPTDRSDDPGRGAARDGTDRSAGAHGGGRPDADPAAGRSRPGTGAGAGTGPGEDRTPATAPTRDELADELRDAREALERVRAERDDYRDDAERLRERVRTLEARIEALEAGDRDADADADVDTDAAEHSLTPAEALAGTNLFVRYRSKSDPTLEDALDGDADPEAVNRNLRVEQHTRFESAGLVVDGKPFDTFLPDTFEYQFVEWVIRDLLYELRSTGSRAGMEQLYDAIPVIDRIQFGGEVKVGGGAAGGGDGDATESREFDVICRDRMGGPLLVANLHESRDPTPAGDVATLIEDARTVAATAETIGAAFVVTTSYYDPQALDAASSATGGGFLSRTRKESYVKMDRKRGFHLCLVEARDGDFNLRIPEL